MQPLLPATKYIMGNMPQQASSQPAMPSRPASTSTQMKTIRQLVTTTMSGGESDTTNKTYFVLVIGLLQVAVSLFMVR